MWLKLLIFSSSDTKAKKAPTGQAVAALFEMIKPYICGTHPHKVILAHILIQEISHF